MRTPGHGDQAWWRWDQRDTHRRLVVLGPLGRVVFTLRADPGRVVVTGGNGRRYTGARARPLVERLTGWRLPTADLSYWLRGLPRPGRPSVRQQDAAGRLSLLEQDGWRVHFHRYVPVQGLLLPQLLSLTYPRTGPAQITLRLLVQRWQLQP